jgi:secreted Zn-dependent insulinase-like peptidase
MTHFDASLLRWFVGQLTLSNVNVYYSSRRNARLVECKEAWYGAEYGVQQLPQTWLDCVAQYLAVDSCSSASSMEVSSTAGSTQQQQQQALAPVPSQLHLPEPNWALPKDFNLRLEQGETAATAAGGTAGAIAYDGAAPPPTLLLEQPGLCAWHRRDISYGLPKASALVVA